MARITGALWLAGILLACAGTTQARPDYIDQASSPSVSADGRYVAYVSDADGVNDVLVRDNQNDTTTRVSVDSTGNRANATTPLPQPAISGDGRFVAFVSNATNLVAGDSNNVADIFVHDRQTGVTTRVSINSSGGEANAASSDPAISADGRYVAFVSAANNLVAGDTNGVGDIFVYDRQTRATTRVSVSSAANQGNADSVTPSLSADGRYVAFASQASNLVTGDTNRTSDVFVRDRQTGATTRVSVGSSGTQGNNSSREPSFSADGRFVAFTSQAGNLVTGDTNGIADVFVYDRQTANTTRVSVDSEGNQWNSDSDSPSISGDGRFVAFRNNPSSSVVFVHDRQTKITDGGGGGAIDQPSISSNAQ